MLKIAISGKARTGKNTAAKFLKHGLQQHYTKHSIPFNGCTCLAFSEPIKQMATTMFPKIPGTWLYGPSQLRDNIIEGAFKNGQPLTVRQLLIDLGTELGRGYQDDIWLHHFDSRLACLKKKSIVIVEDVRFVNEFEHLKKRNFHLLRIKRQKSDLINNITETQQDLLNDDQFSLVINNDASLRDLQDTITAWVKTLLVEVID